ncbi:hypothetical protein K432DRAFT_401566 [Lepidopterella palustris CBS 459.81]|uniref:Rhodopsin domain-containing protein n=1 Tax=Lepidopterella palustris CBS 459.81 TaxID=1314670 RepID=A0A8E2EHI2_9PEZI|nr:hypothetical protein K432DRAFT_401566 [Lepidopterella palustris CBS 459.81]
MSTIIPAIPPPVGEVSNFHGQTKIQRKFILTYSCTLAFATVFLALRMYTRGILVQKIGLDDTAIVLAWMFSIAFFICSLIGKDPIAMNYGFGRHMWDTPATSMKMYLKLLVPIIITYIWAPMLTKFSILILYHRVNPNKWFRACLYIIALIITSYSLATIFIVGAGCQPTESSHGYCLNQLALWQSILNIATDFLMMLIPLPMLYKLQLPVRQKIALGFIFMVGSSVVFTSIVRITYIMNLLDKPDITYYEATACVWSSVELNFGIICNCLTVLKPFAKRHMPGLFSSTNGSHSKSLSHRLSIMARFRKDRDGHNGPGYQLGSMDNRTNKSAGGEDFGKGQIVVTSTYRVEAKKGREAASESMEDIITPSRASGSTLPIEGWKHV